MPANIKKRRRDRRQAVLGAGVFVLFHAVFAAGCLAALRRFPGMPGWAVFLVAALAVLCVLLAGFALVVLKQRFQEIEGGELDAAAEY